MSGFRRGATSVSSFDVHKMHCIAMFDGGQDSLMIFDIIHQRRHRIWCLSKMLFTLRSLQIRVPTVLKKIPDICNTNTSLTNFLLSIVPYLLYKQQRQQQQPRSSQRAASPRREQGSTPRFTSTDPRLYLLSVSLNMLEIVSKVRTNWRMVSSSTHLLQNLQ